MNPMAMKDPKNPSERSFMCFSFSKDEADKILFLIGDFRSGMIREDSHFRRAIGKEDEDQRHYS